MDQAQFAARVTELSKSAFSVAYVLLGNASDCEEAASAAILSAYENLGKLRSAVSFRAWFLKILKNECYGILRRRARLLPLGEELPAECESLPARNIDLQRALMQLPKSQRVAVVLQVIEGYRIDEIARILDVPSGTVKSRLSRAKQALKQALTEEASTL